MKLDEKEEMEEAQSADSILPLLLPPPPPPPPPPPYFVLVARSTQVTWSGDDGRGVGGWC